MAVSGTMELNRTTLMSGRSAIESQRGTNTWGANWVYSSGGAQEDVLLISEELSNLSTSGAYATDAELAAVSGAITTSGSFTAPTINSGIIDNVLLPDASGVVDLGTANLPFSSGAYFEAADTGVPMQLIIYANGLVSGVAV